MRVHPTRRTESEHLRVSTQPRVVVGNVADIPAGTMRFVSVGKFGVGVYNVGGEFQAIVNYCPHHGGPVCFGSLTGRTGAGQEPYEQTYTRPGEFVRCPWHGWEYDLKDGRAVAVNKRIRKYQVEIEGDVVVLYGVK